MTLGTVLRELRIAKGWTQQELSMASSVTQTTISRAENDGLQDIGTRVLVKLAEALGVSLMEIVHRAGILQREPTKEEIADIIARQPEWQEFILALDQEPIRKKRRVFELAKAAAEMDWS